MRMTEDTNAPRNATAGVDFVALPVGRTIGRYTIVSVIGHGGFGITYRALDTQLGREVAIKEFLPIALAVRQDATTVLPRSAAEAEDFDWARSRFVDEGRTLASLHDAPAIVRVFDFLEANGTAYLVMQLLSGETLEQRLKQRGPLGAADVQGILWPLLDGLEHVHDAGFLHRDIKPANILLNDAGKPTLIDFGASRAAIAGRSAALTAIFTPGYAAAEQMTSARQGPWTDIYGLSATLYHAITGHPPPNVFERMMEDGYEPLGRLKPVGFAQGLLVGLDAGLAVKATDRPLSIAGWRPILARTGADEDAVTVAMTGRAAATVIGVPTGAAVATPAIVVPASVPARRNGLWIGITAAVLLLAAGGGYLALPPSGTPPVSSPQAASVPPAVDAAAAAVKREAAEEETRRALREAQAAQQQAEAETARLKKEAADTAQQKADAEAAEQKRIDDAARQKADDEAAEKKRVEDAAQQKADADARRKVEENDRKAAEAGENALRLGLSDRQKIQIALTAQGFDTRGADGTFGARSREMIAAWQRSRGHPATGYLVAAQQQALLREAAAAISKFDDDERKKAEEIKRKAEDDAKARAAAPPTPAVPATPVPAPAASAAPTSVFDGVYGGALSSSTPTGGQGAMRPVAASMRIAGGQMTGEVINADCGPVTVSLPVSPSGAISGSMGMYEFNCSMGKATFTGRVNGSTLVVEIRSTLRSAKGSLSKRD
jgi:peptidoglycan hydrolase-like protein with peptidoglycan-binding domain